MGDEYQESMAPDQGLDVPAGNGAAADGGVQDSSQGVPVSNTGNPSSLDEAFRMLRSDNGAGTDSDVSESGTEDNIEDGSRSNEDAGGSAAPEPTTAGDQGNQPATQNQSQPGRPAQQAPAVDANSIRVILQNEAVKMTRSEFDKQGAKPITINDLYQRDEQTGRVSFTQDFVNAWNQQINDEMRSYANEVYRQLEQEQADVIRLVEFNDTYQKMPPVVQQTFEALLQPYQTTNAQGQIVFPGADFNRLHQQAINIVQLNAARGQQVQQQAQAQAPSQPHAPAVDLKSGSSSTKKDQRPPRTLGEAMQRVNEEKKAARQKKGKK